MMRQLKSMEAASPHFKSNTKINFVFLLKKNPNSFFYFWITVRNSHCKTLLDGDNQSWDFFFKVVIFFCVLEILIHPPSWLFLIFLIASNNSILQKGWTYLFLEYKLSRHGNNEVPLKGDCLTGSLFTIESRHWMC